MTRTSAHSCRFWTGQTTAPCSKTRRTLRRSFLRSSPCGHRQALRTSSSSSSTTRRQGRDPVAVPPRDRRRSDDPRGRRAATSGVRPRRRADADRGRLDGLHVRRRVRRRPPRDAVLRDVREPGHLPRGLDRGHATLDPMGGDRAARNRRRYVGALRGRRLDAGSQHCRRQPRQAGRAPAALPPGGDEVQRPAVGRPAVRAFQPGHRRPSPAHPGEVATPLRWHGPALRKLHRRDQEQVARRHRRLLVPDSGAEGSSSPRGAGSPDGAFTCTKGVRRIATTGSA